MTRASDFDFELPADRIAQAPLPRRDDARLYVLDGATGTSDHHLVRDLPSLLPSGALLVVNDTRVIPARLRATKPTGGKVELLLCEPLGDGDWRCIGGASKPIRPGPLTLAGDNAPSAEVLSVRGEYVDVRFGGDLDAYLDRHGEVPLPPYIKRDQPDDADRERYQTVFARERGAVAAPTAGLHFTPELLAALDARGIGRASITLHVGPGTFAPLRADELEGLALHAERYAVSDATARAIAENRAAHKPIVAVGTTVVRTLEAAAAQDGIVRAGEGVTSIFIQPGHRFAAVDMMLTNFHLPRSSLLILVAAFAGRERILAAYDDAVARGYRFYSYGDAMLLSAAAR
ncbi:MAG: S-adenosylmethionine:tRNA ribosyltransferase-isomerase [Myxococcales bacterium]|nr:S-adenosylmethionine:tRNA ribosyltransferase-isomerase [Myxococcales bacterium]